MFKNVASQKVAIFAWDNANSVPKTGDAANISAQISKDGGGSAATNDVAPTELDATNQKGVYLFDMTQAESNADLVIVSSVSSTEDIDIRPVIIYTRTVIAALLPTSLVGGRMNSNVGAINGSVAAAVRHALAADQMIPGTVDDTAHTPTDTEFEADDITEATANHFGGLPNNGRLVLWTTGALIGQVTPVTGYSLVAGRGHFTVEAMTEAPADDDTFILI